jgi:hypothetical protein
MQSSEVIRLMNARFERLTRSCIDLEETWKSESPELGQDKDINVAIPPVYPSVMDA